MANQNQKVIVIVEPSHSYPYSKFLEFGLKTISGCYSNNLWNFGTDLDLRLEVISKDILEQPTHGYLSLFTVRRLTIKCALLTFTLLGISYTDTKLTLNIENLGGSFFFNFFLMALVEAPGYAIGNILMVSHLKWKDKIELCSVINSLWSHG